MKIYHTFPYLFILARKRNKLIIFLKSDEISLLKKPKLATDLPPKKGNAKSLIWMAGN